MSLTTASHKGAARRETSDSSYVLQGLLFLLGAALALAIVNQSMNGRFADTGHVTAVMTDIGGGVVPGSDVKMRGVVVGRVASIGGTPEKVILDLELSNRSFREIAADVQARVLPASVFGTSYVDLVRTGVSSRGTMLAAGATILQDASARTLELQQALDSVDRIVKALGPADLSIVLHSLAGSLDGRGKALGETIDRANHLLSVLNPRIPLLADDLHLLDVNLQTLKKASPNLLNSLVDTADIAHNIVKHRVAYARLLVAAVKLVDDGDGFLDRTEQAYVRAIIASADVSDAVYDNRSGIARQTVALDTLLKRVLTVTDGGAVRIDIRLVNAAPLHYYTADDCAHYENDPGTNCVRN